MSTSGTPPVSQQNAKTVHQLHSADLKTLRGLFAHPRPIDLEVAAVTHLLDTLGIAMRGGERSEHNVRLYYTDPKTGKEIAGGFSAHGGVVHMRRGCIDSARDFLISCGLVSEEDARALELQHKNFSLAPKKDVSAAPLPINQPTTPLHVLNGEALPGLIRPHGTLIAKSDTIHKSYASQFLHAGQERIDTVAFYANLFRAVGRAHIKPDIAAALQGNLTLGHLATLVKILTPPPHPMEFREWVRTPFARHYTLADICQLVGLTLQKHNLSCDHSLETSKQLIAGKMAMLLHIAPEKIFEIPVEPVAPEVPAPQPARHEEPQNSGPKPSKPPRIRAEKPAAPPAISFADVYGKNFTADQWNVPAGNRLTMEQTLPLRDAAKRAEIAEECAALLVGLFMGATFHKQDPYCLSLKLCTISPEEGVKQAWALLGRQPNLGAFHMAVICKLSKDTYTPRRSYLMDPTQKEDRVEDVVFGFQKNIQQTGRYDPLTNFARMRGFFIGRLNAICESPTPVYMYGHSASTRRR